MRCGVVPEDGNTAGRDGSTRQSSQHVLPPRQEGHFGRNHVHGPTEQEYSVFQGGDIFIKKKLKKYTFISIFSTTRL